MRGITHETEVIGGKKGATQNEKKSPIHPFSVAALSSGFWVGEGGLGSFCMLGDSSALMLNAPVCDVSGFSKKSDFKHHLVSDPFSASVQALME